MSESKISYEFFLVLSLKLGEEKIENTVKKFNDLIESNAELSNVDKWGKRRLAYLINKEQEAYYVLFTFTCNPDFPSELSRVSKITEGVLRSLVVRKDS